ncbi:MAG: type II and III secretion system protein family protein [Chakrabartia sp.]
MAEDIVAASNASGGAGAQVSYQGAVSIEAQIGRAKVVNISRPVTRIAIGDDSVADYKLVSPRQIYLLGKSAGITNLILWHADGARTELEVGVSIDPAPVRKALLDSLPNEGQITVSIVGSSIVLGGVVSDALASEAAVHLADAYATNLNRYLKVHARNDGSGGGGDEGGATAANKPAISGNGMVSVINLMKVRDGQQVMLEVRIAEVSKTIGEQIGIRAAGQNKGPNSNWAIGSNYLPGTDSAIGHESSDTSSGVTSGIRQIQGGPLPGIQSTTETQYDAAGNIIGKTVTESLGSVLGVASNLALAFKVGGNPFVLDLEAQKKKGLVKILAEPTIVAMSGHEGRFLAGGSIFIPVRQAGVSGAVTLEEREFGVGLKFIPTVLDNGRINLQVNPEVSSLESTGSTPVFSKTSVSTNVELRQGQSLVIGGLLKNNMAQATRAFPILGELPILGALFRSRGFQSENTELMIIVRPTLVAGTEKAPKLPTDDVPTPTAIERMIGR